ncbi:MAG: malto-oligosyltrehalose trehalohydrolase [Firmicutes bacterium]|jgi:maltooligosyltrehalose trehalohydrolase|nr:malto-oligosyltrehalose trehalohydrolase [Bacillota bacterium]
MEKMGFNIIDREKARIEFRVFAYQKKGVSLLLRTKDGEKTIPMEQEEPHIYSTVVEGLGLDVLYKFSIENEGDYPDPYSNYQPQGVHGFSQVIDHGSYSWNDGQWKGRDLEKFIIYELHPGTFSPEGTFKGTVEKLDYLLELGINAIELMPVTQTPGRWNWGYDGANLFSVNKNYGTPDDLKHLVDTCHQKEISVILDVVYNHLGPEGNYLPVYGPYFTEKHKTGWGAAVNYDDAFSEYTRAMVLENIRYWLEEYHIDCLRLDAIHAIMDESDIHILQQMSSTAKAVGKKIGRKIFLIAETDENNVKIINPPEKGGYGIDAQWMDDFHHIIHSVLTGEKGGYYQDYGRLEGLEKAFKNYLYTGEFSQFWQKNRGTDASQNPGYQFVVSLQNHDQVGNRARGGRISVLVDFHFLKAAAGLIFLSPYIPLLFMGEEYAEKNPFLFFTDYEDSELQSAVSEGRREEFKDFNWDDIPNPQDERSFFNSKLTPRENWNEENQWIFNFYRDLINLRKTHPALMQLEKENTEARVNSEQKIVEVKRWNNNKKLRALINLGEEEIPLEVTGSRQIFNSEWKQYGGKIEGDSSTLYKGNLIIFEES